MRGVLLQNVFKGDVTHILIIWIMEKLTDQALIFATQLPIYNSTDPCYTDWTADHELPFTATALGGCQLPRTTFYNMHSFTSAFSLYVRSFCVHAEWRIGSRNNRAQYHPVCGHLC